MIFVFLLNCYEVDDSYICFIESFSIAELKNERKSQMKKTNACMVDFTLPLWVVKGGKKDMACLNSLSLSYYFRLLGYH